MINKENLCISIKKIYALFSFELKMQKKKFVLILLLSTIIVVLQNLFVYIINPGVPPSQENFISGNLTIMSYMNILIAGLLFSGIICDEFKKKTGLTLFPLITKDKILLAKFCANTMLMVISITYIYLLIIYFDYFLYAEWIIPTVFRSYGFAILCSIALASLISLFSSFLPSSPSVLLVEISLMFIGFDLIALIISSINYQIEPVFSLTYLFKIVSFSIFFDYTIFPRYEDIINEGSIIRMWAYPDIYMVIIVIIIYSLTSLIITFFIFKRKQL